jgi:tRNA threonylcarbamoyladenosine biosynthesis protein TsaB
MKVLAVDTATEACSVALWTEAGVIARFKEMGRGHAEEVLGMVEAVLQEAGLRLSALDGIAAGVGPGSFTGVRISVSAAQGLAFGADLPVVPVTSLEALASQVLQDGIDQALACLDARMGEVYWGAYRADIKRGVTPVGTPGGRAGVVGTRPVSGQLSWHWTGLRRLPRAARASSAGAASRSKPCTAGRARHGETGCPTARRGRRDRPGRPHAGVCARQSGADRGRTRDG